jgi:hypothetical protein
LSENPLGSIRGSRRSRLEPQLARGEVTRGEVK